MLSCVIFLVETFSEFMLAKSASELIIIFVPLIMQGFQGGGPDDGTCSPKLDASLASSYLLAATFLALR
jgi:hypothetical protein